LFSYFLHLAPDIKSVHSTRIPVEKHAEIFYRMIENRHFYYEKFCHSNVKIDNELLKANLLGNSICLKCKRYVCKKAPYKKAYNNNETDLDCFLRHIRNSIAHGRVYYLHKGNRIHVIFEDFNSAGTNYSARIVCIKADLIYWKKVLSNPDNYTNN